MAKKIEPESGTEELVIEFEGNFDIDRLAGTTMQLQDMDTDEPIIVVDKKYYKIDMQQTIGTRLLHEKLPDGSLKYAFKTDKIMTAKRVMMKPN